MERNRRWEFLMNYFSLWRGKGRLWTDDIFQRNYIVPSIFLLLGGKIWMCFSSKIRNWDSFFSNVINAVFRKCKWDVLSFWTQANLHPSLVFLPFCFCSFAKPKFLEFETSMRGGTLSTLFTAVSRGPIYVLHTVHTMKLVVFSSVWIVLNALFRRSKSDCVINCLDKRCIN